MGYIDQELSKYFDSQGISQSEVAKKLGVTKAYVNALFTGRSKFGKKQAEKFGNLFGIQPVWLLTGEGEMLKSDSEAPTQQIQNGIPLIPADAMAGIFQGEVQISPAEYEMFVIPAFRNADFLIPVKGDSMQPRYYSGDIVACKMIPLQSIFFQWGKVYVVDTDQGALIKKVEKGSTDETITLVSDNAEYKPFEIPRSCIYHIALVQGVIRAE